MKGHRYLRGAWNRKADQPSSELEITADADTLEEIKQAFDDAVAGRTGVINRLVCDNGLRVKIRRKP